MKKRAKVKVEGIVQGVGFRPFCYRTAEKFNLSGSVKNMGDAGVNIVLEGEEKNIRKFLHALKKDNPPLSKVEKVKARWSQNVSGLEDFRILESDQDKRGKPSVIPPDICLCDECYQEMMDPNDRRYHYPFITCVNCGPRFTVIKSLPYDRERTSMADFPLCEDCQREYTEPSDRRYHAEPNCCPKQGPKMRLHGSDGMEIKTDKPIKKASKLLDSGKIVAIKGIGGMHVASKVTDDSVLEELRRRFRRPQQPLAIMSNNLEKTKEFARVTKKEEEILTSYERPILLLKKRKEFSLSELISPGLDSIGVMLPYSGIHFLLFHYGKEPAYVMTSANMPGLPMIIENQKAIFKLSEKVDYFLLHNREIINRCDDSVVRLSGGKSAFLRRSRGYVPTPIKTEIKNEKSILSLGADLDNTISISKDNRIFPSQYLGDIENIENIEYLKSTADRFMNWLGIKKPDYIACDLHPDFSTTELGEEMSEEMNAELIRVQHHKAHLYSLMAEKNVNEMVGIAADGVGYGEDGTIWGGEIMEYTDNGFQRIGGIEPYKLPGGDLAAKFPARALAGILWKDSNDTDLIGDILNKYCEKWLSEDKVKIIFQQLAKNINTPSTSSTGRVLDAISCLLGVCGERTYEGEPAIKLEAFAESGDANSVKINPSFEKKGEGELIDVKKLILEIVNKLEDGAERRDIAAAAQKAIARGFAQIAISEAKDRGIKNIGVSGGVFYNDSITRTTQKMVKDHGLNFVRKEKIPPGDGGISIGQTYSIIHDPKQ